METVFRLGFWFFEYNGEFYGPYNSRLEAVKYSKQFAAHQERNRAFEDKTEEAKSR